MSLLVSFGVLVVSLFVAARILDGMEVKGGLGNYVVVALLFGVTNTFLGPALYHAIGIGTLGVGYVLGFASRLAATAIVLKLVDAFTDRLRVKDFKTAFLAALLMSVTTSACEVLIDRFGMGQ